MDTTPETHSVLALGNSDDTVAERSTPEIIKKEPDRDEHQVEPELELLIAHIKMEKGGTNVNEADGTCTTCNKTLQNFINNAQDLFREKLGQDISEKSKDT